MRGFSVFALCTASVLALSPCARADVTISSMPTRNMDCGAGLCKPTTKHAVLNVGDLQNLLAVSNIEVTTGQKDIGIVVDGALSWTSANQLDLITHGAISIRQPISVLGTGSLALSSPPVLQQGGRVIFWDLGGHLRIGADDYTLVGSITGLASAVSQNANGFYALANDYDATADGTYAASPIGNFDGIFDGLGNTISNLTINDPSTSDTYLGLFSELLTDNNANAALRNLTLDNIGVTATRSIEGVGGLVGLNNGTIANVHVGGAIVEGDNTGGVAGYNEGHVTFSSSSASVTTSDAYSSGGLIGQSHGSVDNSSSSGTIGGASSNAAGGLVGYNNQGSITASHSSSTMTVGGIAGGLSGTSQGPITLCYATGNITKAGYGGGLVAFNSGLLSQSFATGSISNGSQGLGGGLVDSNDGTILQSYARGSITNGETSGGFAAGNSGTIQQSYSTGHVSKGSLHGGFVGFEGYSPHELRFAYWDTDTSGFTQGAGNRKHFRQLVGLTTAQFQSGLPDGFDPTIWGQSAGINDGYPYLLALPPPPPAPKRH
ncbi:MAG TPA: GLUG motif-containing protein [Rhizomicrobium sp.]|jgi:hypothetical protein|nr:GLUG motif-containing protein [Rhizomicrobium sp.]